MAISVGHVEAPKLSQDHGLDHREPLDSPVPKVYLDILTIQAVE